MGYAKVDNRWVYKATRQGDVVVDSLNDGDDDNDDDEDGKEPQTPPNSAPSNSTQAARASTNRHLPSLPV